LGRTKVALREAKKAAEKWQMSFNTVLVGYLYIMLGQKNRGDRWIDRAIKRAEKELRDDRSFMITPFGGRRLTDSEAAQYRRDREAKRASHTVELEVCA